MNEEFDKLLALLAEQKEDYTFQIAAARQLITRAKEIMDSPYPANVYLDKGTCYGEHLGISEYKITETSELDEYEEFFLMVPVVEKRCVSRTSTLEVRDSVAGTLVREKHKNVKCAVVPCDNAVEGPTTAWECPACLQVFSKEDAPLATYNLKERLRNNVKHPRPNHKLDVGSVCFVCQKEVH